MKLAADIARCTPLQCNCLQAGDCARANDWPRDSARPITVVDASIALAKPGAICPIFIDRRTVDLKEAA